MATWLRKVRKLVFILLILTGIPGTVCSFVFKRLALVATTLAVIVAMVLSSWSCQQNYSRPTESITFGAIPSGSAALIYIAQEQHYFAANGLKVDIKDYATGIATIDALLKGDVDIAWAAEFPFIRRAFAREAISIIATVSRFSDQYLFGRRDRGVNTISDLKGRKIGVPRGTIAEFYLGRFLELNGINVRTVSFVDVPPAQSMEALTSGTVDGVVTWEPFAHQIKVQLADKTMAWPVQSNQAGYGVIISKNDWISGHPETINRFLKSLALAEDYLVHNSKAARGIVQQRVNYDDTFMNIFWSEVQFCLSLDQLLIVTMEDEARWMISNNLITEKTVPNFLNFIYADSLKSVKPDAVRISGK